MVSAREPEIPSASQPRPSILSSTQSNVLVAHDPDPATEADGAFLQRLAKATFADMPFLLSETLEPPTSHDHMTLLVARWLELDPEACADTFFDQDRQYYAIKSVFKGWARLSPEAAARYLETPDRLSFP